MPREATTLMMQNPREFVECESLLAIVSPDMYRKNAFRVLGLGIEVSLRDAIKQLERRRMLAELGQPDPSTQGRLEFRPPLSLDEIKAAEAVIHDPEQRLVHELFWFWPLDGQAASPDPALQALERGDLKTASKYWEAASGGSTKSDAKAIIAKHNLAVRWHVAALEMEARSEGKCWSTSDSATVQKSWSIALAYWNDAVRGDSTWNSLSARVIALDDDRLSLEFVQSMRKTIGQALLKINGRLALGYVEANDPIAATAQVKLLVNSSLTTSNPAAIGEIIVAPVKARIRLAIAEAEQGRASAPDSGIVQANQLLAVFAQYQSILGGLSGSTVDHELSGLSDEVASQCLSCVFAFHHLKGDDDVACATLQMILPLARSPELRQKIQESIETGRGNQQWNKLKPLIDALETLEANKGTPKERLSEFVRAVETVLPAMAPHLAQASKARDILYDRMARALREIGVDSWNQATDAPTAFDAISRAEKYGVSAEVRKQLAEDRSALIRLHAAKRRELQTARNKKYGWGVASPPSSLFSFGMRITIHPPLPLHAPLRQRRRLGRPPSELQPHRIREIGPTEYRTT
jgi:hypothetical protein